MMANEYEEVEQEFIDKKYYDPSKRIDIVSPSRFNVIENYSDRNPDDMLRFIQSMIGRMLNYCPDIYKEYKLLMDKPETSLHNGRRVERDIWDKYYNIGEKQLSRFDESGQLIEKYNYELESLEALNKYGQNYSFDVIFGGFIGRLFSPGFDNICIGAKGSGKSNFMLLLGEMCLNTIYPKYEILTNIQLKNNNNPGIKQVYWLSEVLRYASENKKKNNKLDKSGRKRERINLVLIIDEGDNFIQSLRTSSNENVDWLKFIQWTRKIDISTTMIFHRKKDVPTTVINSPNLNAIIYKGIDLEGDKLPSPQQQAIIDFKGIDYQLFMVDIPECKILDTYGMGSFRIKSKTQPKKSISVDDLFSLTGGVDSEEIPELILNYLDEMQTKNMDKNIIKGLVEQIEKKSNFMMLACGSKTEYSDLILSKFIEEFKLESKNDIVGLEEIIKDYTYSKFTITKIEKKLVKNVNYKTCSLTDLKEFLNSISKTKIKNMVNTDYRKFNKDEIDMLHSLDLSKQKLLLVYGTIKEPREYILSM